MLLPVPQVGYYPEYPSLDVAHDLPFWIFNPSDVSLMIRMIQQKTVGSLPIGAYFVKHTTDIGDIIRQPFSTASDSTSAVNRVAEQYSRRLMILSGSNVYAP